MKCVSALDNLNEKKKERIQRKKISLDIMNIYQRSIYVYASFPSFHRREKIVILVGNEYSGKNMFYVLSFLQLLIIFLALHHLIENKKK